MASRDGPYSCGSAAAVVGIWAVVVAVAEGRSGVDTGEGLLRGTGSAVDVCAGPSVLVVSASSSDDDDDEQGKVPTGSLGNICRGSRTTADDIWAAVVLMLLPYVDLICIDHKDSVGDLLAVFFNAFVSRRLVSYACARRAEPTRRFQFTPPLSSL